ncbi:lysozyme inhibitor LprI family protein [Halalkalibacillus halophilus]|uniref:lysozyme inhibitor LprI family protein n=1 Tax=Halalkalibacillus halophilus TaxID=392827 RepID=UPI000483964C|nr:lysozyme inhibitor LprI family protein [Halalkalibacillus halophilus]
MTYKRTFFILIITLFLAACGDASDASNSQSQEEGSPSSDDSGQEETESEHKDDSTSSTNSDSGSSEETSNSESKEENTSDQSQGNFKEEYLEKLEETKNKTENLEATDSSTYALKKVENDRWELWDELLNEIYGVLTEELTSEEMEQLREEQRDWIEKRDERALEASLEYEGGTQEQLEYVSVLANVTEERCYELVEEYMD